VASLRDYQRSRVYEAEHLIHRIFDRSVDYPVVEVAGSRLTLPVERKFASIADVQRYVDKVLALDWVRGDWERAGVPVIVTERAGTKQAVYLRHSSMMAVPVRGSRSTWALRELVILHELAHHLAQGIEIAHGPSFVDRLIALFGGIIGPEAALLTRVTMLDIGVRVG
jgi:putative metallohydrolase (TIGR04338 family)